MKKRMMGNGGETKQRRRIIEGGRVKGMEIVNMQVRMGRGTVHRGREVLEK